MNTTIVIPILAGIVGGWLINYLSDVLPRTRRISRPTCPNCNKENTWNSYLLLKPCVSCGEKRQKRTYYVFLIILGASLYIWLSPPKLIGFWFGYLLLVYLGVVFVIDFEHRLIMHPVSYAGAAIGFVIGLYANGFVPTLIGGAFGFGVMLLLYFLGEVFARYMAKRRGQAIDEVALGFGDVNLAGITGLLLGWPLIGAGLLFTIFAGGIGSLIVIAVMLIRKRYEAYTPIPYAPFLILSVIFFVFR